MRPRSQPGTVRAAGGESAALSRLSQKDQWQFEVNPGEGWNSHEAALMRDVKQVLYEKALAWIAYQRGGHNGRWPPRSVGQCVGWAVIRMIADVHEKSARAVAMDLVDYVERNEKGERQP